ncbi:MAG TPA: biotin--[acetyl-CoA-carboxylase] ligase [Mycobacterium sp.]|nr:biotin--[acetyl-CoA-carboxylase] ligase [Mycobacterium sp.]
MTTGDHRPPLQADVIRGGLVNFWRRLDIVPDTGSTNADMLGRSAAGEEIDGSVLVADYQRAGRGRHGRAWYAPARSQIAVSVGVNADAVPTEAWGWLPLLTGVAVVDAVREISGIAAGLKWPNDVLVGCEKLAGILAEVAAPAPVIVVGIGLNVTLTKQEAPDPVATSLLLLGSPTLDRNLLLCRILRELATRIDTWQSQRGAGPQLVADYERLSMTLGRNVRAGLPGDRQIVGVARSVDELGRLRIDTGSHLVTVSAGDITHLRPLNDDG